MACCLAGALPGPLQAAEVGAALTAAEVKNHPFLEGSHYPQWSKLTAEQGAKDVLLAVEMARKRLDVIASVKPEQATYENVFGAFENVDRELDRALSYFFHLCSVMDSPAFRAAKESVLPVYTEYTGSITANERLWSVIKSASQQPWIKTLSPEKQRYVQQIVDSFRDNGADLSADQKARRTEILRELSELTDRFGKNVLDSTKDWKLFITDRRQLAGMPEHWMENARKAAEAAGRGDAEHPQWLITMDYASYGPVMQSCDVEATRKACWEGNASIGAGRWDNAPIVARVMELRRELAELLGFDTFADLTTARRMVESGDHALSFIDGMMQSVKPAFDKENAELLAFAAERTGKKSDRMAPWDRRYYMDQLAHKLYDFDKEELRPYQESNNVIRGMFSIYQHLYDITIKEVPTVCLKPGESCPMGSREVWYPGVRLFEVYDNKTKAHLGSFYMDLYPRESKRGGAWVNGLVYGDPARDGKPHDPHLATICANLTPPNEDGIALYSHTDVETLFHEFGHMMHVMLGDTELRCHMGTSVAWDFVELPSQLNENWTWEPEGLASYAFHYKTGEPIPQDLVRKMQQVRYFMPASENMGQLCIAKLDLEMHMHYNEKFRGKDLDAATNELLDPWRLPQTVPSPSIMRSLTHCVNGGYAAGYYSYKWAEVLAADAFSRFRNEGLMNEKTGADYRSAILSKGDSKPAAELYRDFMGRDPNPDALLQLQGLLPATEPAKDEKPQAGGAS